MHRGLASCVFRPPGHPLPPVTVLPPFTLALAFPDPRPLEPDPLFMRCYPTERTMAGKPWHCKDYLQALHRANRARGPFPYFLPTPRARFPHLRALTPILEFSRFYVFAYRARLLGLFTPASSSPALPDPRSPTPDSRFPIPDPRPPIPDSRFPIPDSRFPIPDSRFPIPDSRFPIPDPRSPIPDSRSPIPDSRSPNVWGFLQELFPRVRMGFPPAAAVPLHAPGPERSSSRLDSRATRPG
jgi:hypothetical protein